MNDAIDVVGTGILGGLLAAVTCKSLQLVLLYTRS